MIKPRHRMCPRKVIVPGVGSTDKEVSTPQTSEGATPQLIVRANTREHQRQFLFPRREGEVEDDGVELEGTQAEEAEHLLLRAKWHVLEVLLHVDDGRDLAVDVLERGGDDAARC